MVNIRLLNESRSRDKPGQRGARVLGFSHQGTLAIFIIPSSNGHPSVAVAPENGSLASCGIIKFI